MAKLVLYRPHRGSLDDSMREVIEVNDFPQLVRHLRRGVERWYPPDKLPTEENTTIERYGDGPDPRIGWDETWIVLVNGNAWGFTNGPLGDVTSAGPPHADRSPSSKR
jgi:hypothetical protein